MAVETFLQDDFALTKALCGATLLFLIYNHYYLALGSAVALIIALKISNLDDEDKKFLYIVSLIALLCYFALIYTWNCLYFVVFAALLFIVDQIKKLLFLIVLGVLLCYAVWSFLSWLWINSWIFDYVLELVYLFLTFGGLFIFLKIVGSAPTRSEKAYTTYSTSSTVYASTPRPEVAPMNKFDDSSTKRKDEKCIGGLTTRGKANGSTVYEGKNGGKYYYTSGGNVRYLQDYDTFESYY